MDVSDESPRDEEFVQMRGGGEGIRTLSTFKIYGTEGLAARPPS